MTPRGLRILRVDQGSPAQCLGLTAGDEILSVNGHPVPDELALQFHLAEEDVVLEVRKEDRSISRIDADLSQGRPLGARVEDFKTRTCNNACIFCFIDQLPAGVRSSLRLKDDDYRLSFLHGNYITLTNLPDSELDRIIRHALSPLYVSVHTTDPDLRARILGRRKADNLDRKIRKLINGGIRLHTQIVLMPGINDGPNLERTVHDLYGYYPGVDSIAIVPLGLSEHGKPREVCTPVTPTYCGEVIAQVTPWQREFRDKCGQTFAYMADEFYLQGKVALPDTDHYDDFAQIEDGVGMVRRFLDDFEIETRRRRRPRRSLSGTLVTGKLFKPVLTDSVRLLNERFGCDLRVIEAENHFMGKSITVAGLLAGRDILDALAGREPGDFLIFPEEALSRTEGIFIDDLSAEDISMRIRRPAVPGGRTVHDLFVLLFERAL
jgi:putative radical SAM enzyme (TIGR03279 family)